MTVMYWLVAAAVFVVIEIMTMGLTTIWFAGGALVGAVMAAVSLPLWSQIIAFAVISVILLILTRPSKVLILVFVQYLINTYCVTRRNSHLSKQLERSRPYRCLP